MTGRIPGLLAIFVVAGMAHGAPSGLNTIPTADIYSLGSMAMEMAQSGSASGSPKPIKSSVCLQLGMTDRLEFGYDSSSDGESGLWNVKFAVGRRKDRPVAAAGIQNVGRGAKAQMYAVGRADLGRARLHMGLIQSGNTAQPMLGFDAPLASRVTVQADYTAGSENSASIGFSISLGEEVGITAAMIRSNSGPERNNYMLLIGRYFSMPDLRRQPY